MFKIKLDMIFNRHEYENLKLGVLFINTTKMSLAESEEKIKVTYSLKVVYTYYSLMFETKFYTNTIYHLCQTSSIVLSFI